MAQNSKIEWCDHTFNIVHGCAKVSPGCDHCYAETIARRWGGDYWGHQARRQPMSESYWQQPLAWNDAAARRAGRRARVFCSSMADVFERHPDVETPRTRLWSLIEATPHLDWQLLTKRPHNIARMVPPAWLERPRPNVWYGTSVENQEMAKKRIPRLLDVPAVVRFLSCEPLLGPLALIPWLTGVVPPFTRINWVIAGGESGPHARPMHPDWARQIRDQCQAAGTPFLFKQWGESIHESQLNDAVNALHALRMTSDCQWEDDLSVSWRVGKKVAGRLLDGREWNEFPKTEERGDR